MLWLKLNRQTGEAGGSDFGTVPIWLRAEAIQFIQAQRGGTRIYLRSGAIESIDVTEAPDEVMRRTGGDVGVNDQNPAAGPVIAPDLSTPTDSRLPVVVKAQP